jgi:hypothetical protein
LHTVEIRLGDDDVAAAMSQMRTWLDHHRFEPDSFRQLTNGLETRFRLEFKIECEAGAVAAAVHGRVLRSTPKHGSRQGDGPRGHSIRPPRGA